MSKMLRCSSGSNRGYECASTVPSNGEDKMVKSVMTTKTIYVRIDSAVGEIQPESLPPGDTKVKPKAGRDS